MKNLSDKIPVIKRARDYWLYDSKGNRYLDLYQNGGFSLLGHRPRNLTKILKNTLSKGLIYNLPSIYSRRLKKQLKNEYPLFPHIYLFSSMERALNTLSDIFKQKVTMDDMGDIILRKEKKIMYVRPFVACPPEKLNDVEVIIPVLPFLIGSGPIVLCSKFKLNEDCEVISPLLLAGLLRGLYDLKKYSLPEWYCKELLVGCNGWRQAGIYILPLFSKEKYPEIFDIFLENKVLLSTSYSTPSILPNLASKGEVQKLLNLFKTYPGEH